MKMQGCITYLSVNFNIDTKKNVELLKIKRDCLPEELGILNKDEVEKFLKEELGLNPVWKRHHFVIGYNDEYDIDVNAMIRVTLKDILGKESIIKELKHRFGVETSLEIVPYIAADGGGQKQNLSLDKDVIAFLDNTKTHMDLDYYVI